MTDGRSDAELAALLEEQRSYYAARAAEYDEWWERRGRYDGGEEHNRAWELDIADAVAQLRAFRPKGAALELAAGTGNWTWHLARFADSVVAVDANREVLEINDRKLRELARKVDFVLADLFDFRIEPDFDVVFMGFWLTHVPEEHFESLWHMVRGALRPGGRVFIIDNAPPVDGRTPSDVHVNDREDDVTTRNLADGRTFDIVKRFWQPQELEDRLAELGWRIRADRTINGFFLLAHGEPA